MASNEKPHRGMNGHDLNQEKQPDLTDDPVKLNQVWIDVDKGIPNRLKQAKEELIQFLDGLKNPFAAKLLREQSFWIAGNAEIDDLADVIATQEKLGKEHIRDQIAALGYVIAQGNEDKRWSLPLPPIPVYIRRERNPFTPVNFGQLQRGRAWAQTVFDSILKEIPLSDEAKVGRILLNAITRGGLLDINSADALLSTLHNPLSVVNDRSFIDLSLRWQGHDDVEGRRWFPDPLTELLILKSKAAHVPQGEKAWRYIQRFFRETNIPVAQRPKSMTALIEATALDLRLRIPPILVNYATRAFVSHSLKRHAWLRLQGIISADHQLESSEDEPNPANYPEDSDHIEDYGDTSWNSEIRQALNQPTKPQCRTALAALNEHLDASSRPSIAKYISAWAEFMVRKGSKAGHPLTMGTIKSYVSMLSLRLYGLVNEEDLASFNIEAFEEIYEQVLEEATSSGMRRRLAKPLREFHYFLVKKLDVPDLDNRVLGAGSALAPVDANIISLEEFTHTLRLLENGDLILIHPDMVEIAQLISILAFRCGLRRSEVLKLRLIDVQGKVDPEILVRPHATRRLKTKNSTRRVLLSCLLEAHELKQFLDWTEKRRQHEASASYSPYLFSIPENRYAFVPEELIFPAIHKAMRTAAGDNSLRFHHFRHSCASWNALRLMIADFGMPEGFFESMPDTYQWLCKSHDFKQSLYRHDNPTRKHIYSITSILGHSSPDITLEHYIHWCDVLCHHAIREKIRPVDKQVWVKASGLAQANIYRWLADGGEQKLLKNLRKKFSGMVEATASHAAISAGVKSDAPIKAPSIATRIDSAWKLLYLHSARQIPIDDLAERYGFTPNESLAMVKEARRIASLKSKDRHKSFRHRILHTDAGKRLICPARPRDANSIKLAEEFLGRLHQFMNDQPDESRWVIKYYIDNAWAHSNDLIFRSTKSALRFLHALKSMGITNKSVRITWYYGKGLAAISNKDRKKYWREQLQIPRSQALKPKQLNDTRPLGKYGWLGIRLLDLSTEEQSSYGFRYAFIMSALLSSQHFKQP